MNKNNKNIDFKIAATLFLHSEYILRYIEQNIYSIPNIEVLKEIITNNPEHQTVFDFLITAIFLKFHKNIYEYNKIILNLKNNISPFLGLLLSYYLYLFKKPNTQN